MMCVKMHITFAVIVLDASGKGLFAKNGPLSDSDIENTIRLIENHMS